MVFDKMASRILLQRYFLKFDLSKNQQVFEPLYQWFFKLLQFDKFTLDVESPAHPRYGSQ